MTVGLLDTLKNLVIEDDARTVAPVAAGQSQPATVAGQPHVLRPALNQAMVDAIRKQTFGRNTALTALTAASDALADIIPDQTMRLKAAQKTAGAGRAAKEFVDAVQIHLNDVDAAERDFAAAVQKKIGVECGGLGRQADQAETVIAAKQAELQGIQARIGQLQAEIGEQTSCVGQLRQQAATKEADLRQSEVEFKAAACAVRDELNSQKQTILSTLGTA